MGARLLDFLPFWEEWVPGHPILEDLRHGWKLVFRDTTPPTTTVPVPVSVPRNLEKARALREEVDALVSKGAVHKVDPSTPGFYSHIFLVPKKNGTWRLVIDLSKMNKYLQVPHFKMETTRSVAASIREGEWTVSLDLMDAYFHVPIFSGHQRFLRFFHEGICYQFVALPFGLASAPLIFTSVVKAFIAPLRQRGFRLHVYLDDWLLRNPSRVELMSQLTLLQTLASRAGFIMNLEKSELTPMQDFVFIGVRFLTAVGMMVPPPDRITKILSWAGFLSRRTRVQARRLLQLLGLLNSAADQIPYGRLHMRPLQLLLLSQWRPHRDDLEEWVNLPQTLLREVWEFWTSGRRLSQGVPLSPPVPDIVLVTDASLTGWGGHLGDQDQTVSGHWSQEETMDHINILELKAVSFSVRYFLPSLTGKVVSLLTDNSTVVSYIRKEGGTHSDRLCRLTWELLQFCRMHSITLVPRHIPGKRNVLADSLSRTGKLQSTEWTLKQQLVDTLCTLWGSPNVDLFALKHNKRLPVYVSALPDPEALAVDALSMSWDRLEAYAYPPTPILPAVLRKVACSQIRMILIAPFWPSQPWFPELLELLMDHPRRLQTCEDLLYHPIGRVFHGNPGLFRLTAWRLSGMPCDREDYRSKLQTESPDPKRAPLLNATNVSGENLYAGVIDGKLIPFHQL